jgi:hypothetical protein
MIAQAPDEKDLFENNGLAGSLLEEVDKYEETGGWSDARSRSLFVGRKSKRRRRLHASAAAHSQSGPIIWTSRLRVKRWLPAVG